MSIGDVAAATGLRPSALRYYEERGLIRPASRTGGKRHYDPSVLRRLSIVALCQEVGFTVSEIAELLASGRTARTRWHQLAGRKLADLDAHIQQAKRTKQFLEAVLACGCADPANCSMVSGAAERKLLQLQRLSPQT